MVIEISNLKQEVRILKYKLPTDPDPGDPSQPLQADLPTLLMLAVHTGQVLPEPDPTPAPMSLSDNDVPALRTNDYREMEAEVSLSYNCIVCSIRNSNDQLSPNILSIMPRHMNRAAKRQ